MLNTRPETMAADTPVELADDTLDRISGGYTREEWNEINKAMNDYQKKKKEGESG